MCTVSIYMSFYYTFHMQELDYHEFKMFAMACIDRQIEIEKRKKTKVVPYSDVDEERAKGPCGWCSLQ